jgi:hypothetical protein
MTGSPISQTIAPSRTLYSRGAGAGDWQAGACKEERKRSTPNLAPLPTLPCFRTELAVYSVHDAALGAVKALRHSTDIIQTHRGAKTGAVHTLLAVFYNMATEVDVAKRLDFATDLSDALPRVPQRDSVLQALAEPSLANLQRCAPLQAPLHTATHFSVLRHQSGRLLCAPLTSNASFQGAGDRARVARGAHSSPASGCQGARCRLGRERPAAPAPPVLQPEEHLLPLRHQGEFHRRCAVAGEPVLQLASRELFVERLHGMDSRGSIASTGHWSRP